MLQSIPVTSLEKSELNERMEEDSENSETFQELVNSIETLGDVNDPPLVRPIEGGGYEVIKGSRRLRAAKKAEKIEDIRCEISDVDDTEALKRTITDNIESFEKDVSAHERARSLYKLWNEEFEAQKPSARKLGELLGVSSSTVQRWLEPLNDTWEDTVIDPLSENRQMSHGGTSVLSLTPKKLKSCRRATDTEEEALRLAKKTAKEDLTVRELANIRSYNEDGVEPETAIELVTGDLSEDDIDFETEKISSPDSPEQPTSPSPSSTEEEPSKTSTAELSNSETWGDPEDVAKNTDNTETDEETETSGTERPPIVSEEDKELAEETPGWADTLEEIEQATAEDGAIAFEFEVYGPMVDAVEAAVDDAFQDQNKLAETAIRKYLKEGNWLE